MTIRFFALRICVALPLCGALYFALPRSACAAIVVDFEDFNLAPESYMKGPAPDAEIQVGVYGEEEAVGRFTSQGVGFSNSYTPAYGSWSGFAISTTTDTTTEGYGNQFSAITGSGAGDSSHYGVAFGYMDAGFFDSSDVGQLRQLPSIYLPANMQAQSTMITNTTYAALSMQNGDGFGKAFGGASGTDPDFFKLTVYGIGADNQVLGSSVDFMLADYQSAGSDQDYILKSWARLDLTPLAGAQSLHFNLASSDLGDWGMNTPSYFAIDNLTVSAVPEPSGLALLTCLGLGLTLRRCRANRQYN